MVLAVSMAAATAAMGQIPGNPGQPRAPGRVVVYGAYVAAIVCLLLVGTGSFKPAKRTHQD